MTDYPNTLARIGACSTRGDLRDAWQRYEELVSTCDYARHEKFAALVESLTGSAIGACAYCSDWEWQEELNWDESESDTYCDDCKERHGYSCEKCDAWSMCGDDFYYIDAADARYCSSCRDDLVGYCDDCEEEYLYSDGHDCPSEDCDCEPCDLHFQILANGRGVLHEDERIRVELPQGFISDEAIAEVKQIVWEQYRALAAEDPRAYEDKYCAMVDAVNSLERAWQTKRGNFTRRLSKALYESGIRLDPGVLSRVGSKVREHSDTTTSTYLEITRDLNQPADAFYHGGSCWWGSYSSSRCALKNWGGFALRSYASEDACQEYPTGRAWIQPLGATLAPTADTFGAHAYVVYNGYGELSGYTPARLIAHLTSRTYKKIDFSAEPQYINAGGYLIADQETCDTTTSVTIRMPDVHRRVAA